jgi:hypothetical protein
MDRRLELVQMPVSDVDRAARRPGHFTMHAPSCWNAGVEVGEVQEFPWGSFVFFSDPDGNSWSVQAIPPRDS